VRNGHKDQQKSVEKVRSARKRRLKAPRGRGNAATEESQIFVMIKRGGGVNMAVVENICQVTIMSIVEKFIKPGTFVNTDEFDIYFFENHLKK